MMHKRIQSFFYAFRGIFSLIISEKNAWIHTLATITVCSAGFYFGLTKVEWCFITVAIVTVWTAEAFNTALEHMADALSSSHQPLIASAKDIAAGAVLISALGSVIIGVLIFGPYLISRF
jgi:diacylglycerol kinase (ATP)